MPSQWYYQRDGQKHGPVSSQELKHLAQSGEIQPSSLVWKEGIGDWVDARRVKGLFSDAGDSGIGLSAIRKASWPPVDSPNKETSPAASAPTGAASGGNDARSTSAIHMSCSNSACGHVFQVSSRAAGTPCHCPKCKQLLMVPANSDQLPSLTPAAAHTSSQSSPPPVPEQNPANPAQKEPSASGADGFAARVRGQTESDKSHRRGIRWKLSRLWQRAKHDAKVLKLKHEVAALRKTLDEQLREAGLLFLESEHAPKCPAEFQNRLEAIAAEVEHCRQKIESLGHGKGTWSVERGLRRQMRQLSAERDEVVRLIGQHAYEHRMLPAEQSQKVADIEELIRERSASLEELAPGAASAVSESDVAAGKKKHAFRQLVIAGVFLIGILAFWFLVLSPIISARSNPLRDFRYEIPENADFAMVLEGSMFETEWGKAFEKVSGDNSLETLGIELVDENQRALVTGTFDDETILVAADVGDVAFGTKAREVFRRSKQSNETVWIARSLFERELLQNERLRELPPATREYMEKEMAAKSNTKGWLGRAAVGDLSVTHTSSGRFIIGGSHPVHSAINRQDTGEASKMYEKLANLAGEIPHDSDVWVVFERLPKKLFNAVFNTSESFETVVDGGYAYVLTTDGQVLVSCEVYCPDEAEAKYLMSIVESYVESKKEQRTWSQRLSGLFGSNSTNVEGELVIKELLDNLRLQRDGEAIRLSTSVSERALARSYLAANR